MQLENQFDHVDIEILKILQNDGRIPYMQLAKELNISNSLVHQRIAKLKKAGVIQQPKFEINPAVLGYSTCAHIGIVLKESKYVDKVVEHFKKIPECVECLNVTGKFALILKIYAKDNDHLRNILYDKVHHINEIAGTSTSIIFSAGFRRPIPLTLG